MRTTRLLIVLAGLLQATGAQAQGFALGRYNPTPAGTWTLTVDHPWYSSTRYFAARFTLDYGHDPLIAHPSTGGEISVVQHQLLGHFDLAGSFLDRVQLNASLPVVFLERGTTAGGAAPLDGASVGDPRLGLMVRLWGHSDKNPVSIHLGGFVWIPVGMNDKHAGDGNARGLPKIVLAGLALKHLRWSVNTGVLIREQAQIVDTKVGTSWQLGGAIAYADLDKRFHVGPELLFSTIIVDGKAFTTAGSSLELLVGGAYNIAKLVQVGLGVGAGFLREAGTPDARILFRVGYEPIREEKKPLPTDRDNDGLRDDVDACPDLAGPDGADPKTRGCPDRDKDGVIDPKDQCPDESEGFNPDPKRPGCPLADSDMDGVVDAEDQCPKVAAGDHPDPLRRGCPFLDKDKDGVPDEEDLCPDTPAGAKPDPKRAGCPLGDQDGDGIMDDVDACPDRVGPADSDPTKNGCPKVVVKSGTVTVLQPVNFARNKDTVLPSSFPMLQSIAKTLIANQQIKRVSIEGHADDTGTMEFNQKLSEKRAKKVMEFLVKKGVKKNRLESHGFGNTQPTSTGTDDETRAKNRRVEFRILEQK